MGVSINQHKLHHSSHDRLRDTEHLFTVFICHSAVSCNAEFMVRFSTLMSENSCEAVA